MNFNKIMLGVAAGAIASHIVTDGTSDADRWVCGVLVSTALGLFFGRYA